MKKKYVWRTPVRLPKGLMVLDVETDGLHDSAIITAVGTWINNTIRVLVNHSDPQEHLSFLVNKYKITEIAAFVVNFDSKFFPEIRKKVNWIELQPRQYQRKSDTIWLRGLDGRSGASAVKAYEEKNWDDLAWHCYSDVLSEGLLYIARHTMALNSNARHALKFQEWRAPESYYPY